MDDSFSKLLAPRIIKNCLPLFNDGYFKHSAREAMVLVELALKEKGKVEDIKKFGKQLIGNLFAGKTGVRLRVPLGDELHDDAKKYFKGVFAYYRNYTAHDGSKIGEKSAQRILVIASELLELIDSSELSLSDHGGVDGLVQIGGFGNSERLGSILKLLNDYHMLEDTYDGLYEDLAKNGFGESELESVFTLNLIEMHSEIFETPNNSFISGSETVEWLKLTELGSKTLESIENSET